VWCIQDFERLDLIGYYLKICNFASLPFNFGHFQFVNWKGSGSVSQSAEEYLIFHKFGHVSNHNFYQKSECCM
jgi:hypothetical protein